MKLPFSQPERGEPNSEAYAKLVGNLRAIAKLTPDQETREALEELARHWTVRPPYKPVHEREQALRDALGIWAIQLKHHTRPDEEMASADWILLRTVERVDALAHAQEDVKDHKRD